MEVIAAETCEALAAALERVREARDASAPAPTREAVAATAAALKHEAAKVGFTMAREPGADAARSLLGALADAAGALCALLASAAARGGPTLHRALAQTAEATTNAAAALVRGAAGVPAGPLAPAPGLAALPQLAGALMERADAAGAAPLDDRAALGRALTLAARQVADATLELAAAAAEAEAEAEAEGDGGGGDANGNGHGAEGGATDSDDEFGGAADPRQSAALRAVHGLLDATVAALRAAVRTLLAAPLGAPPGEPAWEDVPGAPAGGALSPAVEAWERVLAHVRELSGAADELAACAYGHEPGQPAELRGAAAALLGGCERICGEAAAALGDAEGGAAARAALESAAERAGAAHGRLGEVLAADG
jgi:hypothetical protein